MNLYYLFISMIISFGISIAFVEKSNSYPMKFWRIQIQKLLHCIHWKFSQALYCTVCTSFWAALIVDVALFFISGYNYFMWPLSGFASLGFTWFLIDLLNTLDKS